MHDPDRPIYLSKLRLDSDVLAGRYSAFRPDAAETVVLRSCLMKPEHEAAVADLHAALDHARRPGRAGKVLLDMT